MPFHEVPPRARARRRPISSFSGASSTVTGLSSSFRRPQQEFSAKKSSREFNETGDQPSYQAVVEDLEKGLQDQIDELKSDRVSGYIINSSFLAAHRVIASNILLSEQEKLEAKVGAQSEVIANYSQLINGHDLAITKLKELLEEQTYATKGILERLSSVLVQQAQLPASSSNHRSVEVSINIFSVFARLL